jgi:hypothetical protein
VIRLTASAGDRTDVAVRMNESGDYSFVWIVLLDGQSIFARCDHISRQALVRVLSRRDRVVRLLTEGQLHHLRVSDVAAYTFFETSFTLPSRAGIYEFAGI